MEDIVDFPGRGSWILYAMWDIWETTSKGPYLLGDSFGVTVLGSFRFVPSSQTFVPTLNGLKRGQSLMQDSCALRCASWAASLASLMLFRWSSTIGMSVLLLGWCIFGVYPMSRS